MWSGPFGRCRLIGIIMRPPHTVFCCDLVNSTGAFTMTRLFCSKLHLKCCDGRVVKALDLKSNGIFPRRFEPCSQRQCFVLYKSVWKQSFYILKIVISILFILSQSVKCVFSRRSTSLKDVFRVKYQCFMIYVRNNRCRNMWGCSSDGRALA